MTVSEMCRLQGFLVREDPWKAAGVTEHQIGAMLRNPWRSQSLAQWWRKPSTRAASHPNVMPSNTRDRLAEVGYFGLEVGCFGHLGGGLVF